MSFFICQSIFFYTTSTLISFPTLTYLKENSTRSRKIGGSYVRKGSTRPEKINGK